MTHIMVARRLKLLALFFMVGAITVNAQVNVLTQHNDNARTGQNIAETVLTPKNVNPSQFGKLFSVATDGQLYGQPLYVANLAIPGKGTHNVVFVVTEADSVYAFDADGNAGANAAPLWRASLVDSTHGAYAAEAPVTTADVFSCTDLNPQMGITSTPVIDLASGSMYVEAKSHVSTTYIHRLHVLDITTGNEKTPGSVVITATVPGTGAGSSGGQLTFDALYQLNRPALLLSNGTIYVGFGSYCDIGPYHGWLFAYDQTTLKLKGVFVTTPNGGLGGIWGSGSGISADAAGNVYLATGNGTFRQSPTLELGDSIVKLAAGTLSVLDYFTPMDQKSLESGDLDVGSGGVLLLPDQPGAHPHLLVQAGKAGHIYLLDRDNLTTNPPHYCNGCTANTEIVQESPNSWLGNLYGASAYWNNTTYWGGSNSALKSIPLANGTLNFAQQTNSYTYYGFPGTTPSISANGSTNGILWAINSSHFGPPGPGPAPAELHAYDATNIKHELYGSNQAINHRDAAGNAVKFTVPTIANGKVFVGTTNELDVYGLLPATPTVAAPSISPASGTFMSSVTVSMSDAMQGANIYYTTNGANPTTISTRYTGPFKLTSWTTLKAMAAGTGFKNSNVVSASYQIGNKPIMYETESLPFLSSGPTHQLLPWFGFSNGTGTALLSTKVGDNVTYTLNVGQPGTYDVKVGVKKYPSRGIWQLSVNAKPLGPLQDEYTPMEVFAEFDQGTVTIPAAGNIPFNFAVTGRNSAANGYSMSFDYIKLTLQ